MDFGHTPFAGPKIPNIGRRGPADRSDLTWQQVVLTGQIKREGAAPARSRAAQCLVTITDDVDGGSRPARPAMRSVAPGPVRPAMRSVAASTSTISWGTVTATGGPSSGVTVTSSPGRMRASAPGSAAAKSR